MKIVKLSDKYFEEMCQLYCEVYSFEPSSIETVRTFLKTMDTDLSFVSIDDEEKLLGGIFCKVNVFAEFDGRVLHIQSIQVKNEHRKMGIAKLLVKEAIAAGKLRGLKGVDLDVQTGKDFPENWYKKIGFEIVPWMSYQADIDKINI